MWRECDKNRKIMRLLIIAAASAMVLSGCGAVSASESLKDRKERAGISEQDTDSLVVYSPHPLDFINPIVSEFEAQTGISVQVRTGGTGELLKWTREGDELPVMYSGEVLCIRQEQERICFSLISAKMKKQYGMNLRIKREI